MKHCIQLLMLAFISTAIFSCKKNDTPAPEQKTYLVKETRGTNITIDYKYDNQNRFAGNVYRDAANHQETVVTKYNSNGNPAEAIFRDYTNNRAALYVYTYDSENRCIKTTYSDSVSATSYNLRTTYDFSYTPSKITRTITNASSGAATRNEIILDAKGNITKEQTYKADGTLSFEYNFTVYDDKKHPYSATFSALYTYPVSRNNYTAYNGGLVGGTVNNYTATYTYNSDGYPTQTVWNTGYTYTYTYEKR